MLVVASVVGVIFVATARSWPDASSVIGYTGTAVMVVALIGAFVVYGRTVRLRLEFYRIEAAEQ